MQKKILFAKAKLKEEERNLYCKELDKEDYDSKYKGHLTCINGCEARIKFTQRKNNYKFFSTWNKEGKVHNKDCPYYVEYKGKKGREKLESLFKTFGFTRLSKPKGSPQPTRNHRSYDFVTVSSTYCKKCHSEGFGIATDNVVATGIPRTDVFFDENYKAAARKKFYDAHPTFKGKKIILFAPTFRGMVKETAFYPTEMFDINEVCSKIPEDYAIIIKHHPFVNDVQPIPDRYADRVIDLSADNELNDLLFVTDVIITDYSSLVFEASLIDIPMIFLPLKVG